MRDYRELVHDIHRRCNEGIVWTDDMENFGVPEFWKAIHLRLRELGKGDCDDIMLTKRMYLLEEGMPHDIMWLQLGWVETGGYHAMLRVWFPDTDLVLCNRQVTPMTPADLQRYGYTWDKHIRSDGVGGWRATIF